MVHPEHPTIESGLLRSLTTPGSAFAITFLFLVFQYTFKLDFQCPCEPNNNIVFCVFYTIFPAVILFCILTLTSQPATTICLGIWKHNCTDWWRCLRCCCEFCSSCYIFKHIIRNIVFSLLWIVVVLIDGDVYACWHLSEVNVTSVLDQIPCKEKEKLTPHESDIFRNSYTVSQIIGLGLLFIIPVLWTIFSLCCKCWTRESPYNHLYEDLREDEVITLTVMKLQKRAKEEAERNSTVLQDPIDWPAFSSNLQCLLDNTRQQSSETPSDLTASSSSPSSTTPESSSSHSAPSSTNPETPSTSKTLSSINLDPSSNTSASSSATLLPSSTTPEPSSSTSAPSSRNPETSKQPKRSSSLSSIN